MKAFLKQSVVLLGAGIAAACCLGIPAVLAALGTLGPGFILHDAYLFPHAVGFAGFSLWLLYRSARQHGRMAPFWLSLAGAAFGAAGLWFMVTGVFPQPWSVYVGLAVLVAGSVWDYANGRRAPVCEVASEERSSERQPTTPDLQRRAMTGAALSVAAAGAFYALYKSVDVLVPQAEAGEVVCWGINECKGTTACTTAFNACTSQNDCKGQGYIFVPEKECFTRGGELLVGSPGDPAKRN
ncbi:MAG: MerC domain-containing protein [Woeseia sp.]